MTPHLALQILVEKEACNGVCVLEAGFTQYSAGGIRTHGNRDNPHALFFQLLPHLG